MKSYKLTSGQVIVPAELRNFENVGHSEVEIAEIYKISRQHLHNIRKKLNCPVRFRSDRGVSRKSGGEKRSVRAENARKRYEKKELVQKHCYFCKGLWDPEDGIHATDKHNENKYVCGNCCRMKFDGEELKEEMSKEKWRDS